MPWRLLIQFCFVLFAQSPPCVQQFVKACVIVDIIAIVFNVLAIIVYISGFSLINGVMQSDDIVFDDDQIDEMVDQMNTLFIVAFVLVGLSLVFSIVGIVGATKFNKAMVLATGVWLLIELFLVALLQQDFVSAVMFLFFSYPHFGLFLAIKKGHISKETYDRERYCCCDGSRN